MASWSERVEEGARLLGIAAQTFGDALKEHSIDEHALRDNKELFNDFKAVLAADERVGTKRSNPFVLASVYKALTTDIKTVTSEAPVREIVAQLKLRVPNDRSRAAYQALRAKRVRADEPRTWGDVHFVAIDAAGEIDHEATALAMQSLEAGDADPVDGVFITKDGRYISVSRLDEVITLDNPKAKRLVDPLFPDQVLNSNKVSTKGGVVVDLDAERHTMLLFGRKIGLVAAPRDEAEARALLKKVADPKSSEEAAKGLGERLFVRWQSARRAPAGSPAALPSILEADGAPTAGAPSAGARNPALEDGDVYGFVAQPIPAGDGENLPLSLFPAREALAAMTTATADDLREFLRQVLAQQPRGTAKADLAQQILSANPSLRQVFLFLVLSPDGETVNSPMVEMLTGFEYDKFRNEVLWRVIARTAMKKRGKAG